MGLLFDHVFVCVPPGAAAAERLCAAGLPEGSRNIHPGQGTRNRRFFFRSGMLELLWCHDEAEARSPRTARTGLWERCTGACPFGVAWARSHDAPVSDPLPTWDYSPAYLPEGVTIQMAVASDDRRQPLGFIMPGRRGPSPSPSREVRSPHRITRVTVQSPGLSPSWSRVPSDDGVVVFREGPALLTVEVDAPRPLDVDLRPEGVPLRVCRVLQRRV